MTTIPSTEHIAVLVSTRNRAHVASWTRTMIDRQSLRPQVWVVVVDGSPEFHGDTWSWADNYIHRPDVPLGASRNLAIQAGLASGASFLALWDDDDYYAPDHLERMVSALRENPDYPVAGASMTPLYYLADGTTIVAGPYCEGHALEPTLVFRDWYLREEGHRFLPDTRGLSAEILDGYRTKLFQVWDTIVIMCHEANTYDKKQVRARPDHYRAREVWDTDVPTVVWDLLEWMGAGHAHPMTPLTMQPSGYHKSFN
jgi:glycosyltransferase involved in cell wall biosynthesis